MPNIHALSCRKRFKPTRRKLERWKKKKASPFHAPRIPSNENAQWYITQPWKKKLRSHPCPKLKHDRQLSSLHRHFSFSYALHLTILAPLPIIPIPPLPACKLCLTISSAAAAAASLSFCLLRSRRYLSASGRMRRIRKIMSSLGSA